MKARRNNLIRTISFLEERLNALANIEVELKTPPTLFRSEFSDVTN
jgi:hypothetical protein